MSPNREQLIVWGSGGYFSAEIGKNRVSVDWEDRHPLPGIFYGNPPRFYITSWAWLDDTTAVSPGAIETEDQYNFAQVGLFVFNINSKTLRRVNLGGLKIGELPMLDITGVAPEKRIVRLRLTDDHSTNDRIFLLKIPID